MKQLHNSDKWNKRTFIEWENWIYRLSFRYMYAFCVNVNIQPHINSHNGLVTLGNVWNEQMYFGMWEKLFVENLCWNFMENWWVYLLNMTWRKFCCCKWVFLVNIGIFCEYLFCLEWWNSIICEDFFWWLLSTTIDNLFKA